MVGTTAVIRENKAGKVPGGVDRVVVILGGKGSASAFRELLSGLRKGIQAPVIVLIDNDMGDIKGESSLFFGYPEIQWVSEDTGPQPLENGKIYMSLGLLGIDKEANLFSQTAEDDTSRSDRILLQTARLFGKGVVAVILSCEDPVSATAINSLLSSGGKCIVQDPSEAKYPQGPVSVLKHFEVDYLLHTSLIGFVLQGLVMKH
ncbi:chemotaxis protein CheB [Pedobacter sp. R-06]|uniref:chemotaxis protein CheB n=1 Tax=Pedobacter sp. R-06 TaxID=3404051 RepID=UPI003CEE1440